MHRDVKPSNILIPRDGTAVAAKLADLGIARLIADAKVTATGTTMGTAAYFSPEQSSGLPVDARSDVYSLGIVLLESLTGRHPFPGSIIETAAARMSREPTIPPEVGPGWHRLLTAMCRLRPDDRPDAAKVVDLLDRLPDVDPAREATAPMTAVLSPVGPAPTARTRPLADGTAADGTEVLGATTLAPDGTVLSPTAHPVRPIRIRTAAVVAGAVVVLAAAIGAGTLALGSATSPGDGRVLVRSDLHPAVSTSVTQPAPAVDGSTPGTGPQGGGPADSGIPKNGPGNGHGSKNGKGGKP